jgi:hypothetical protein
MTRRQTGQGARVQLKCLATWPLPHMTKSVHRKWLHLILYKTRFFYITLGFSMILSLLIMDFLHFGEILDIF